MKRYVFHNAFSLKRLSQIKMLQGAAGPFRKSEIRPLHKLLLIMRITSAILLTMSLHLSAHTKSQNINIMSRDISLQRAFMLLNQQTGYSFFWDDQLLDKVGRINLDLKNASLSEALDKCLSGTLLTYSIREPEKSVFIVLQPPRQAANPASLLTSVLPPPGETVQGEVRDSTGVPLDGASVMLSGHGASRATYTDKEGKFSLKDVSEGTYTLSVSSVGFGTYEKRIVVSRSMPGLDITLHAAYSGLDEMVVIGYGTEKRKELTASVATVDMKKIAEIASPSINDELGGRMPGVFVTTSGGGPGAQAQLFVRGGNSGNNPPLFVIDGFIRSQTDYLNLNPNDVESFVVLKDAEATAVYGSQGGNGVVLVNTKQGKVGAPVFNYSFNQIWTQPTFLPKVLNSYDKAVATNQSYVNLGRTPPYADSVLQYYRDQTKPYVYPNTNWQKLALRSFAHEERHDFSVSAGNDVVRYYGALSYYRQGSILQTDDSYNDHNDRITYRMNVVSNVKKIGLKITTAVDGYVNSNTQPNSMDGGYFGIFSHIVDQSPTSLAVNQYGLPYAGTGDNPVVEESKLSGYSKSTQNTLNGILGLDWTLPFFKDIHLKGNGNYNMYNIVGKSWNATAPSYEMGSTTPVYANQPNLIATEQNGSTWNLQGIITYNHTFGNHHIAFTGVYEQIQGKLDSFASESQSFTIPIDQFFAGPTVNQIVGGREAVYSSEGYVGRLQYNYASKYFLEGSLRRDGSYLFPPNKRFGLFYGLSGGWIPTEEKFLSFLKDDHILDYLKIRGSYGQVGNTNGVSPYAYLSTYSIIPNAYLVGGQPQNGLSENGLASNAFTWYSNATTNIGVDFATLKSRLSGSFDYFYYTTSGFVVSDTAYARTLGQTLPVTNSNASQRTAGLEVALNWADNAGPLTYRVGITYSNYATLYPIYPGENSTQMENPYQRQSGNTDGYYNFNNPVNGASGHFNNGPGYVASGLYPSNAAVLNGPLLAGAANVAGGDIRYLDANGDGQVNASDQRLIGTNNFAHVNYGLNFSLGYKGWSLDAAFMGTGNRDMLLGGVLQGNSAQARLIYGYQLNYWTPANQQAIFPRQLTTTADNGNNNTVNSTYWLINAKYIRLKSLNLSYDLKRISFIKNAPFTQCRVFLTGRNLFTISNTTKYFLDPESDPSGWGYSVQRTFAVGCNLGF